MTGAAFSGGLYLFLFGFVYTSFHLSELRLLAKVPIFRVFCS